MGGVLGGGVLEVHYCMAGRVLRDALWGSFAGSFAGFTIRDRHRSWRHLFFFFLYDSRDLCDICDICDLFDSLFPEHDACVWGTASFIPESLSPPAPAAGQVQPGCSTGEWPIGPWGAARGGVVWLRVDGVQCGQRTPLSAGEGEGEEEGKGKGRREGRREEGKRGKR